MSIEPIAHLASDDDAFEISELDALLFPDNCVNETTIRNEMRLGTCFIVRDGGEIAGYALVRFDDDLADLLRLGVRPERQGTGRGKVLLERVLHEGMSTMLTVRKDNPAALHLYKAYGFKIVGHREDRNAWVMIRARPH